MKMFVKLTSLVLALLMLVAVFAACGKGEDKKEDDKNNDNVAQTGGSDDVVDETTVAPIEVKDWGGQEYRILGRESSTEWAHNFEVWREELPEDTVGVAVWNRNQTMLTKYNINVKGYLVSSTSSAATTMLNAGEDLYDLTIMFPETHHPLAMQGYLLDLYKLDYVNMEHDGWMDYPNTQLTMGGKLFYTTNKFLVQDKNRLWCTFYNRDMAQELKLGHFEDFVFDGTWTIDKVLEVSKNATYESDGQPGMGLYDNWGVGAPSAYEICSVAFGAGFRITEHGDDGYPVIIGATDRIIQVLDKVYELRGNQNAMYVDIDYGSTDWSNCVAHSFKRGTVLILFEPLSSINGIKKDADFTPGILPNPKYDENQELYYSIPNLGNGSLISVPSTIIDQEFAGYALEAITEESVSTSYHAYIEEKSKLQNASDADCAKCMSMIFDGVVYDIGFISDIGGLGGVARSQIGASTTNNYARLFSRYQKIANSQIEKIRTTYAEMG